MDFTKPINIEAVNNTAQKYNQTIFRLITTGADETLQHLTAQLGVQDSLVLSTFEHNSILKPYTGNFDGSVKIGDIVPRTLKVESLVAEIADEPERYRRSYFAAVQAGLNPNTHPFERWLVETIALIISEDLNIATFQAIRNPSGKTPFDGFDGFFKIISDEIDAGNISTAKNNMFSTGTITRANAGTVLKEQFRSLHKGLRTKGVNIYCSQDVLDAYDDWYNDTYDGNPVINEYNQTTLLGSQKKGVFIPLSSMGDSNLVIMTQKANLHYGVDQLSDSETIKAFISGNPYLFTAAMKMVFGVQIQSIHSRSFVINDQTPAAETGSGSGSGSGV